MGLEEKGGRRLNKREREELKKSGSVFCFF